jgi:tRNA-splicing ligase RtcB (3'-phosphate/5'-hydroxy nucleic acid ligase)
MITGRILKLNDWPEGRVIGLAKDTAALLDPHDAERDATLARLAAVRANPAAHLGDPVLGALAAECLRLQTATALPPRVELCEAALPYPVWGAEYIDPQAQAQMANAMRLPIAVAGGLMPDAHLGYGVPIGAVVATEGAVIPYGVGVDIACRMRLSVFPVSPIVLGQRPGQFKKALLEQTRFGVGAEWQPGDRPQHPVLDSHTWNATRLLRSLLPTAARQLGTSGAGNHFVEWGAFRLPADDAQLGLKAGEYLALLSHSGSRGVGFKICDAYTRLAKERHPDLEGGTRDLAWLELDTEAGQEYWLSMQLAGQFASANHHIIHHRVAEAVGLQEAAAVENHHNFAWEETLPDGRKVIVHRKGATPAGAGVLGVIPGSMADPGYVVRGRGVAAALHSASHGAGRAMSSRKARESITKTARDEYLAERGVTLIGAAGLEESPQAYKDIGQVLAAQSDLVEVVGVFHPRLVRMAGEASEY